MMRANPDGGPDIEIPDVYGDRDGLVPAAATGFGATAEAGKAVLASYGQHEAALADQPQQPGLEVVPLETPPEVQAVEETPTPLPLTPAERVDAIMGDQNLDLALARGRLRTNEALAEVHKISLDQSPQLPLCLEEYEALEQRYGAACSALLDVMGRPEPLQQGERKVYSSWHQTTHTMPDGEKVPLAYEVIYQAGDDGRPLDTRGSRPLLTIKRHIIHRPTHGFVGDGGERPLTGVASGDVIYDADAQVTALTSGDVSLAPAGEIVRDIDRCLIEESEWRAVSPWLEGYLALPAPAKVVPPTSNELGAEDAGIIHLLGGPPREDAATAHADLCWVFGDSYETALRTLLEKPLGSVLPALEIYGIVERYRWVLDNAAAIRASVRRSNDYARSFLLLPAFRQEMTSQERKVELLEQLVGRLSDMAQINDRAPGSPSAA